VDVSLNRFPDGVIALIAVCVIALFSFSAAGQDLPLPFEADLKYVIDGDSIVVVSRDGEELEVRLWGIDAPENGAPWSKKSTRRLKQLLGGQTLTVFPVTFDRYQRLVSEIEAEQTNIGLRLVEEGLAWVYRRYNNRQDYIDTQDVARDLAVGLWADPDASATPPWRWREQDRTPARSAGACPESTALIIGNRRSMIFHHRGCPDFVKVSCSNRVEFDSSEQAKARGFRAARNCKAPAQ